MEIAVVGIGDELLRGFTVNTNLAFLGRAFLSEGFEVASSYVVPDRVEAVSGAVRSAISEGCDFVVTTGGLGPTADDVTKAALKDLLGFDWVESAEVASDLKHYWSGRPGPIPKHVAAQALVPNGALVLPNSVGTAPGWVVSVSAEVAGRNGARVAVLPGPPSELEPMVEKHLIPLLEESAEGDDGEGTRRVVKTVVAAGMPESKVERIVAPLLEGEPVSAAYCASPEGVKIYLSGENRSELDVLESAVRAALGTRALRPGNRSPAEEVVALLAERGAVCAVAESCTAGLVAASITETPGSSAVFAGGFIVYSNEMKEKLLDVPRRLLEKHGAVSAEAAEAMLEGLRARLGVDAGIAVTGIAGPGGGTEDKPVGLVYIAVGEGGVSKVERFRFPGDRRRVRERSAATALNMLREILSR